MSTSWRLCISVIALLPFMTLCMAGIAFEFPLWTAVPAGLVSAILGDRIMAAFYAIYHTGRRAGRLEERRGDLP